MPKEDGSGLGWLDDSHHTHTHKLTLAHSRTPSLASRPYRCPSVFWRWSVVRTHRRIRASRPRLLLISVQRGRKAGKPVKLLGSHDGTAVTITVISIGFGPLRSRWRPRGQVLRVPSPGVGTRGHDLTRVGRAFHTGSLWFYALVSSNLIGKAGR